jgi:hypothetical protein
MLERSAADTNKVRDDLLCPSRSQRVANKVPSSADGSSSFTAWTVSGIGSIGVMRSGPPYAVPDSTIRTCDKRVVIGERPRLPG